MYIKQVIRNRENWWYYIFGIVLIVPAMTIIFSIPHGVAIAVKAFGDEELTKKLAENDINVMMTILESNLNLFLMLFSWIEAFYFPHFSAWTPQQPFLACFLHRLLVCPRFWARRHPLAGIENYPRKPSD